MAAQRATAVYAYGEGVGHLERCLQVQEVLASSAGSGQAPEDKEKRCDLLLVLGGTQILAGETRRMLDEVAPEAFALAEAMGDEMRASRACQLAIHGLAAYGGPQAFGNPEGTRWAERADQYAQPDTVERAWADMSLGTARFATGDPGEVYALLSRALDLARRLDDPDAFAWVGVFWLILVTAPQHGEEGLRVAEELVTLYHANVSGRNLGSMFMFTGSTFLVWGQCPRAEEMWSELDELVQRTGQPHDLLLSMTAIGVLATLDGRLEDAVAMGQSIVARGDQLGPAQFARVTGAFVSMRPLLYSGKGDDALQLAPHTPGQGPLPGACGR